MRYLSFLTDCSPKMAVRPRVSILPTRHPLLVVPCCNAMEREFWLESRVVCEEASTMHGVHSGHTYQEVANVFSTIVEHLQILDPNFDCDSLQIGSAICVERRSRSEPPHI